MKTKITLKMLEKRIGKKLSKDNHSLHKTSVRGMTIESLVPYYIVNDNTNSIASQGISILIDLWKSEKKWLKQYVYQLCDLGIQPMG